MKARYMGSALPHVLKCPISIGDSCVHLQKIVEYSGMSRELIWPEFALPDEV